MYCRDLALTRWMVDYEGGLPFIDLFFLVVIDSPASTFSRRCDGVYEFHEILKF